MPRFDRLGDYPVSPEEAAEFAFAQSMIDRTPVSEGGGGYGAAALDAAIASKQFSNNELKQILAGVTPERHRSYPGTQHIPRHYYGTRFPTGKPVVAMRRHDLPEAKAARFAQVKKIADAYEESKRNETSAWSPSDRVVEPDRLSPPGLDSLPPGLGAAAQFLPAEAIRQITEGVSSAAGHARAKHDLRLQDKSAANLAAARAARMGSIRQGEAAMDSELRRQRQQRTAASTGSRRINVRPAAQGIGALAHLNPGIGAAYLKGLAAVNAANIANAPMMAMLRDRNQPGWREASQELAGHLGITEGEAGELLRQSGGDRRAALEAYYEAQRGGGGWGDVWRWIRRASPVGGLAEAFGLVDGPESAEEEEGGEGFGSSWLDMSPIGAFLRSIGAI